ncbi:hypothetical protein [Kitasatospora sp. NPDC057541]|uniref:hypothetical protein n=1 Tax=unclassified Kitasatospora TaxID=2633591 RepID=UPI0036866790
MTRDLRIEQAELHYENAVFGGDGSVLAAEQGLPGVAADLVGLGYLAAQQDRREDAAALAEATELATTAEAHGILRRIAEARKDLDLP